MTTTHPKLCAALIGLGIGRQHALAYKNMPDRFSLDAVCSIDDGVARAAADEFGELMLFHDAITRGHPLPVTIADARRSIELISAIYASAQTGQVVMLPL